MSILITLIACSDFGLTKYSGSDDKEDAPGSIDDSAEFNLDIDSGSNTVDDTGDSGSTPDSGDSPSDTVETAEDTDVVVDTGVPSDTADIPEEEEEEYGHNQTLAVGGHNYCAILSTGEIFCEGWCGASCSLTIPESPVGTYTQISGHGSYCAIKTSGYASCFGGRASSVDGSVYSPPAERFIDVDAGGSNACGVTRDGRIVCWGYETYHAEPPASTGWTQIAGWDGVWCALDGDGYTYCWSMNPTTVGLSADTFDNELASPSDQFSYISSGQNSYGGFCGITTDGVSKCWGDNITPSTSSYYERDNVAMVDGGSGVCYVYNDHSAYCYGHDYYGEFSVDPSLEYDQIAASGEQLTCRIMTDGSLTCHGRADLMSGWGNHPAGTFMTSR